MSMFRCDMIVAFFLLDHSTINVDQQFLDPLLYGV